MGHIGSTCIARSDHSPFHGIWTLGSLKDPLSFQLALDAIISRNHAHFFQITPNSKATAATFYGSEGKEEMQCSRGY